MIKRRTGDKLEELKTYFNTKFNEQEEIRTKTFNNINTDLKKEITKETRFRKQHANKKQVTELPELNINNQSSSEELEQNDRRLC